MTDIHREIAFEDGICVHLAGAGWLHEPDSAARYDRARALFPDDLAAWVQETQPTAWASSLSEWSNWSFGLHGCRLSLLVICGAA